MFRHSYLDLPMIIHNVEDEEYVGSSGSGEERGEGEDTYISVYKIYVYTVN